MKKTLLALTLLCGAFAAGAQNINGTFENWHNYSSGTALEAPEGWTGSDSFINAQTINFGATAQKQVFKSTSAHGGTYAVQAKTANFGGGVVDTFAGGIVNARPNVNFSTFSLSYTNLTPVTARPGSLSAWIKYNPAASSLDSGIMTMQAIKSGAGAGGSDSVIASASMRIGSTPSYTQMTLPLTYPANALMPDRVLVLFGSSGAVPLIGGTARSVNATPGSEIFVDDATIMNATGIVQPLFGQPVVKCFPNPTNGAIHFETASTAPLTWQAFSADGRLVANYTFTRTGAYTFGDQAGGMYLFRIVDKDGTSVQNGSFLLKR